jgi:hypothetical protein
LALNREETKKFVEENRIATLQAFRTDNSPEVDDMLVRLGNTGGALPFYAIFPAENANRPILRDGVFLSPKRIIEALKEAGPSRGAATK